VRQQSAKIKVVGENNPIVILREAHDFRIRAAGIAKETPVGGLPSSLLQAFHPGGAEVHVHQQLHAPPTETSCSSTRQAA
jgi:hypothetical protein